MRQQRIHLNDADLTAWRDQVLFGAAAGDPARNEAAQLGRAIPADAPAPVIRWSAARRPALQDAAFVVAAALIAVGAGLSGIFGG